MITEARKQSIRNYRRKKRDQLAVDVPKGKRDAYKAIAAELGLSLSMLIQTSVETFAQNHSGGDFQPTTIKTPKDTPEQRRLISLSPAEEKLIAEFSKLPVETQKIVVKLLKAFNAPSNQSD